VPDEIGVDAEVLIDKEDVLGAVDVAGGAILEVVVDGTRAIGD
jgi:hypothetical protein